MACSGNNINYDFYLYSRDVNSIEKCISLAKKYTSKYVPAVGHSRGNEIYKNIKALMASSDNPVLFIYSLSDLGDANSEICVELEELKSSHIPLVVANLPSSVRQIEDFNPSFYDLLIDYLRSDSSTPEKTRGRKKIRYPDNFAEYYDKWDNGEITAKEFMAAVGLKKGTFYQLLKEYNSFKTIKNHNNNSTSSKEIHAQSKQGKAKAI